MSRYCRKIFLPLPFAKVRLRGTVATRKYESQAKEGLKILTSLSSDQNVKDTRSLTAKIVYTYQYPGAPPTDKQANQFTKRELLQFLPTLKNLQSLSIDPEYAFEKSLNTSDIPALMEATKHAPLRRLALSIYVEPKPNIVTTPGPTGLDTLCISWNTSILASKHKPGGAFDHLLALITPSLTSLSHLELTFDGEKPVSSMFDLTLLKAAGETLRNFHLEVSEEVGFAVPENPYKIIAEIFPKLTKLTVMDGAEWNDDCIDSLALLPNLTHLTLSTDFEKTDDWLNKDHDISWYRRCFYRRFHATKKIFAKCPQLERFSWKHQPTDSGGNDMYHDFVVVDSNTDQGSTRVLKPVKQWWMVDRYKKEYGGNLPEDMVKDEETETYWEDDVDDYNKYYNIKLAT